MDTPATTRNRTISRSGLGNVAINAESPVQCPTSTDRWPCLAKSVLTAGASSSSGKISGDATDVPPRAAPPPEPAAVLIPRTPTPGSGCRSPEPVGPGPTGVRADQPTTTRHTGRSARGQLDDIGVTPTRRATSANRNGPTKPMTTPRRPVLDASRRTLLTPGSRACATDSNRTPPSRKPV